MEFITNRKGCRLLAYNGFVYKFYKTAQVSYWRCIRNDRGKCLGRLIVDGNRVMEKNMHNHVQEATAPKFDPNMSNPVYIKEEHTSDTETYNGYNDEFQIDTLNSTNETVHSPIRLASNERLPTTTYPQYPVHTLASSSSAAVPPVSTRTSTPENIINDLSARGTKRKERDDQIESVSNVTVVKKEADNMGTFCTYIQAELTKMTEPDAEELLEEMLLVLVKKKKEIRERIQKS